MKTKAMFTSAILMCAAGILSAQTNKIYPFDDFFDDTVKVIKHVSLEDSLFYASLSDTIYPSRNNYPGDEMHNPIQAGTYSASFHYSDMQDTYAPFTHQYGRNTNDVFYRLVLTVRMNVTFTHEGSLLDDTYMYLLDSNGNLIASNDDYSGEAHCSNVEQSFIRRSLAAGTYYIVSEGCYENGIITTNMTGFATEYGYTTVPSSYSTEPGAVGGLGGVFGVSPTGGATYSIPIEVPVGVNGLQPELSIVYNSQSGNGMCGYGTSLAGLSAITRGPKDIYHDTLARGIKYQPDDALYLDGVRLILTSGTPGQEGATYSPESDPFTVVTAYGTCTTTSDNTWFEVKGSDGMVCWYGCDFTSRYSYYDNDGAQKILSWNIDRARQPSGNFINYSYYIDPYDNCLYLAYITYGTNISNQFDSHYNLLHFEYETCEGFPVYFDSQQRSYNNRLKTITCMTGESVYRSYNLYYDNTSDTTSYKYSRLISVTETNGRNESLPTTQFSWSFLPTLSYQNYNLPVSNPSIPGNVSLPFGDQIYVSGDLNNDGLDDIAGLTSGITVNGQNKSYLYIYWAQRTSSGVSYTNGTSFEMPDVFNNSIFMKRDMGDFHSFFNGSAIIDWDGNGINEVLLPYYKTVSGNDSLKFYIQGCNSVGQSCWNEQIGCPVYGIGGALYSVSDLNNDGRKDIVVLDKGQYNGYYYCHLLSYDPSSPSTYITSTILLSLPSAPKQIYLGDMNNNGINDLLVICQNHYVVYWNQGGMAPSSSTFSDSDMNSGSNLKYYSMTTSGDFNGDGLLDVLTNETGSSSWYFNLNQGDGTFYRTQACTLQVYDQNFTAADDDKFHCDVFDFDGDGRTDVVITKASYSSYDTFDQTHTYWMRSKDMILEQIYHATSNSANDALSNRFVSGDFNGDGLKELATYGYNCVSGTNSNTSPIWRWFKHSYYTEQSGKVTKIIGDLGTTTEITYSTLANHSVYTLGVDDAYPVPRYTTPLNVVRFTVQDNGIAGSKAMSYTYSGLKVHLQGRGMLGFSSTTAEDMVEGTTVTTSVTGWNSAFYIPTSTKVKTTSGSDSTVTVTTMTVVDKGSKKYFAYPSQTVARDYDGYTVTTTSSFSHDYGYPLTETVTYKANMYQTVSYSNYTPAGGAYRPQTVTVTKRHPDDSNTFSNTTTYTYNSTTGTVVSKVENSGTTAPLTTSYTYDLWGNITSKTCSATGITTCTTYYSYESSHRFPVRIYTNPSSTVQKYTYDLWGHVLTEQDSINSSITNTVTNTYDSWGNLIRTARPGYGTETYTRGWNNSPDKRYFVLVQGSSRPWVKTWYDSRGREVQVESIGARDISLRTTTGYNTNGQVSSVTEKTGNLTLTTSYSYDNRDRITIETHTGNSTITYSYGTVTNGRTVTVNDNGRQTVYTYDLMGNLNKVKDPLSNVVTHKYASNGGVRKTVAAGSTWTFVYDNVGNRTSMTDPDAGTITYTYDALGRETGKTDARGVVFVTNYDYLGRVSSTSASQSGNTETVTYNYGTSGTGQSRLISKTLGNFTSSYEYDQYGRLTMESNGTHSVSYQYTTDGLVSRMTWDPTGSNDRYVNYDYDSYGNCNYKGIPNIIGWALGTNTGTSTTSVVYLHGSSMFTRRTFLDTNGNLSYQTLEYGSPVISSASYTFSATTGNLTSRTLNGTTRTFTYDNLDRLTAVSVNNTTEMSMSYSANGNISSKTGIGSYQYSSNNKPHAVSSVDNTSGLIDTEIQSISYNLWGKVTEVNAVKGNDTYKYEITYGPDQQRILTVLWKNNQLVHLITYGRDYEERYLTTHIARYYYVSGTDGNAAVYVSDPGYQEKAYCIETDHLGSITALYDQYGTKCFSASYDVWGKRTVGIDNVGFDRGFTGHEHIDEIGLINMNGRMYEPNLGRFISVDPYVQEPANLQNYNRYSYCLNNPLKYTDPSGEFFLGTIIACVVDFVRTAFFEGGLDFTSPGAMSDAWEDFDPTAPWSMTNKSFQMSVNMYRTDTSLGFADRASELCKRLANPLSWAGYLFNQFANYFGCVESVDFYGGATLIESTFSGIGGITIGNYIYAQRGTKADPEDRLFQHEFGHYLFNRMVDPLSSVVCGLISVGSIIIKGKQEHRGTFTEIDANRLAFEYFFKNDDGFGFIDNGYMKSHTYEENNHKIVKWYWHENPLDYHNINDTKYRPDEDNRYCYFLLNDYYRHYKR